MTTLGTLKARIAEDLDYEDGRIDTAIASAIEDAINFYQRQRFYFNQSRDVTFSTVAGQSSYSETDNAAIPYAVQIDMVHKTVSGVRTELRRKPFFDLETLYDTGALSGEPYDWAYYDRKLWLYPIPSAAYTIRILGLFRVDPPASDGETGNVWMTEMFEVIRCRAKIYLALHKLADEGLARTMTLAEQDALSRVKRETALREGTGLMRPTPF